MIPRSILVLLAILSFMPALASEDFEFGPRPSSAVFDPGQLLDSAEAKSISDSLATTYQKEGIDVIVVALEEIGVAPPEHVAKQFAAAWCKSPIHCVVLHVADSAETPWIVPAVKLVEKINPAAAKSAVGDAQGRVRAQTNDTDKIKAAATEASDMLRNWKGKTTTEPADIEAEVAQMKRDLETRSRRWKIGAMIAVATFIPLVTLIVLGTHLLDRRKPRHFHNHRYQRRLGAPYAGGNQVVADFNQPTS